MFIIRYLLVFFCAISLPLIAGEKESPLEAHPQVYVMSVGKSGTHLIAKALRLLEIPFQRHPHPDNSKRETQFILEHADDLIFFNIRDPRDILISMYEANPQRQVSGFNYFIYSQEQVPGWESLSRDEQLLEMIKIGPKCGLKSRRVLEGFGIIAKNKHRKNVFVTKYEELVGPQGNGSDLVQKKALQKICDITRMNHHLIPFAQDNIYGEQVKEPGQTFNKGKIGRWREYFKPEHIEAFKKYHDWNKYLIEFGYETSKNWK